MRVPLAPGAFTTVTVESVQQLDDGQRVDIAGGDILAFDGERDRVTRSNTRITAHIDWRGPRLINVEETLVIAAERGLFTNHALQTRADRPKEEPDRDADTSSVKSKVRSSSGH